MRIDGSYTLEQRARAVNVFKSDPNTRIMLLTLGSGSVGYASAPASVTSYNNFSQS